MPPAQPPSRTVLLAGATGLVGRELLDGLLRDPGIVRVHVLSRRALTLSDPRLGVHLTDFASALPALPPLDEVYLALGTTLKVAGSQQAFRAVDFDANLHVAQAAHTAGARRLGLVSAMGADARSRIFYNRVKGELEDAVSQLGFDGIAIARPSFLAGDRESLGQPARRGEALALNVSRWLGPLIPANYRCVAAADVAAALLLAVPTVHGRLVLLSGALQGAAARKSTAAGI